MYSLISDMDRDVATNMASYVDADVASDVDNYANVAAEMAPNADDKV